MSYASLGLLIAQLRSLSLVLGGVLSLVSLARAAILSRKSSTSLISHLRGETSVAAVGFFIIATGLLISQTAGTVYGLFGMTVAGLGLFVVASVLWRSLRKRILGSQLF